MKYKTEVGPDHGTTLCMDCEQFPSEGNRENVLSGARTTLEKLCHLDRCAWSKNQSEDGAKFNMRWMRGVFVGNLDRTDEFLLLTPTGAVKTRCVRRLEGDNAWDLQFLNLCVGSPWNATARSTQQGPTIQQKDELESGRRAKRLYLRQNILTSTDVLQDAQVVLELGSTQRSAEQELNKKWWTKVTQLNSRRLEIR